MKNRIIYIIVAVIVLVCAVFVACSNNNKNYTDNEKTVSATDESGNLITTTKDSGAVTIIENVTDENGKVIGTKRVNQPTSIKDGVVVVTKIVDVTDKDGKSATKVVSQAVLDKNGNTLTVASTSNTTTKKGQKPTSATGTTAKATTKKNTVTKPKPTTTTDPCTTTDPHEVQPLPEDVFDEKYVLSGYNGLLLLQQRFDIIQKDTYTVNLDSEIGDTAEYTVYIVDPKNKNTHIAYSTIKVNLKNGNAVETNATTKKKTKYNALELPTTTTTTTKAK
ncbi:MAG: hypothetical protein ACI4IN_06860 [Eubacterium sp.]